MAGHGNEEAFGCLYDLVIDRVYGLARHISADTDVADEATVAALVAVWRTSARYDPRDGSALAWIMALAHRTVVEHTRAAVVADIDDLAPAQARHRAERDHVDRTPPTTDQETTS